MLERADKATLKLPAALGLDKVRLNIYTGIGTGDALVRQAPARLAKDGVWDIDIVISDPPIEGPQLHRPAS